jgi:hypothetical protein
VWQELREELHPKGVEVVTVALDTGGVADARRFIDAAEPKHPSLIDQAHVTDELFGFVNVPNAVWIDEEGMIVRPAEPAWPGRNPVMNRLSKVDVSTLPPELADVMAEVSKIKSDPEGYRAAIVDWVEHGADSRYALTPDEVVARSQPRPLEAAQAAAEFELAQHLHRAGDTDAAVAHFKAAHRLQPDNWTYKRQAWHIAAPGSQIHNDVYDSSWVEDVKAIGAENYYPAFRE